LGAAIEHSVTVRLAVSTRSPISTLSGDHWRARPEWNWPLLSFRINRYQSPPLGNFAKLPDAVPVLEPTQIKPPERRDWHMMDQLS
jgi:hypothetical protein